MHYVRKLARGSGTRVCNPTTWRCKLRAVLGSQDSRATTFQHLNSSLHWGISRGRNWFCAMLLKAIKPLKKRKIQRHHYNRNQSPNLRHQSKGMTFLEALLPDASNQWPQCGAGPHGFTGHVNWYHVLRLFSLFFVSSPASFAHV